MGTSKKCSKCGVHPPRVSGRRKQSYCVGCNKAYGRAHYRRHHGRNLGVWRNYNVRLDQLINEHKNAPCSDCGVRYPPYVMDFDHRDPKQKVAAVSTMRRRRMAYTDIEAEIAKCDVVCANCHRERTNGPSGRQPARYLN